MTRRSFSISTPLFAAGSLVLPKTSLSVSSSKFKMGYQLFSVNADMNADPIGTLKQLKAMGYEDFEIYGFEPNAVTYYGIDAKDFKKRLEDLELTVTSGHYGFSDYLDKSEKELTWYVAQCIKGAKNLSSPYITWPWLDPKYRNMDGFRMLIPVLNKIAHQVNNAGLKFSYHNHGFEFEDHNGEQGYELILAETDPTLVKLQMDMYWVVHAGTTTPIELVKQHPGRFVMWHIKDMDRETRDYTELGNGSINYLNVLPDPTESGLEYYYIEQGGNYTQSAIESARSSAEYMKKYLVELL